MRRAGAIAALLLAAASLWPAAAVARRPLAGFGVDAKGRAMVMLPTTKASTPVVIRLTPSGALDTGFARDGILRPSLAGRAAEFAVQPGGGLIIGGNRGKKVVLLRYRPDGSLDRGFGVNGRALVTYGGPIESVMVQPRGQIVALGTQSCTPDYCGFLYRNLDVRRYSPRGKLLHDYRLSKESWFLQAVGMDPRGGFLIAGLVSDLESVTYDRFRPNAAFAGEVNRDVKLRLGNNEWEEDVEPGVSALVAYADGRFVVATEGWAELWLRNPNGSADLSFGERSRAICGGSRAPGDVFGALPGFSALALDPDGKLVAAGGEGECFLIRYLADGRPDPSFGENGGAIPDSRMPPPQGLGLLRDGGAIVAGWHPGSKSVRLVRYTAAGDLDPSFGVDGLVSVAVVPTG